MTNLKYTYVYLKSVEKCRELQSMIIIVYLFIFKFN